MSEADKICAKIGALLYWTTLSAVAVNGVDIALDGTAIEYSESEIEYMVKQKERLQDEVFAMIRQLEVK